MINAAVVGLGKRGQAFIDTVQGKTDRLRFTVGVTRTPDLRRPFATKHGMALSSQLDEVLRDDGVHAVFLTTPHTLHAEQVRQVARAGKHVFCERPFALTRRDAETALEEVTKRKLVAGVSCNRRFGPATMELRRVLDEGVLGKLLHIEGNYSFHMGGHIKNWRASRAESPAGGMTSLALNNIDTFVHLFGRIEEVEVRSRREALAFDIDDTTVMLMGFERGFSGYLATIAATGSYRDVRAFGTKGWAHARDLNQFEQVLVDEKQYDGHRLSKFFPGYDFPALATLLPQVDAFADAVAGIKPFPVSPEDILHITAVLEAITSSAESKRSVRVSA